MKELDRPSFYRGVGEGIVLAGHFHESDSYSTKRPHGMDDWLITYTLGGEGYFQVPGRDMLRCYTGDITLLKPGSPHEYGTAAGQTWQFVWAHFSPHMIEPSLLPEEPLSLHQIENEFTRKRLYRAFRRILSDSRERDTYWQELCISALQEILLLIGVRNRHKIDPRVKDTLHQLSLHMREPIRIDALARSVGLSPSRLSHLFKEHTGQSIIDTLNLMRIRQASLLLEHTSRTASEVCYDVGYHNYNHFINQFRKHYGMSPSSYQKQKRGQK
ncbi:Arabinose operon regulatory protein [compost metagenome]